MRKTIKVITLGLAVVATAALVQAKVININFHSAGGGSTLGPSYFLDGTAYSMPTNYPSTTWNDVLNTQNSMTNLLDTLGNDTGIAVNLSGGGKYGDEAIGLEVLKEYRYFSGNASSVGLTITLTNIPPSTYDIYVLSQGDQDGRTTRFALGTGSLTNLIDVLDATPASKTATTWTDGGNYVKFGSVAVDASGTVVIEAASLSGNNSGSLNGMQLVDLLADAPELYTAITPPFGATYVTNLPVIAVTVTNGTLDVDTGSFSMELVVDSVTNDVSSSVVVDTPATDVTTFSYTPVVPLENGTEYTVLYSVAGIGGSPVDYISAFTTAPDLHYATTPVDGLEYVATGAEVAVTFTNVAVSLSNLYVGCELNVNSSDVTGDVVISYPSDGVMKFEYVHGGLAFSQVYDVQLNVLRSDGYTNAVGFSFTSALDPAVYLIAPGIRNGGFELVDGTNGFLPTMSDWSRVDNWEDNTSAGAKTEAIGAPTEGTRALTTGNNGATGSQTYNITTTAINDGDIFDYKFTIPGRANGVYAGLAYSNATEMVIVSNSLQYVGGGAIPFEVDGSYLFDSAKDPDAIGQQVGIVFIDDASGGGAVYIDEVRLYYGNIAVKSLTPAAGATGVDKATPIEVVIAEAASQVDTNSIVLTLDGVDVTTDAVISDTATGVTVTYTPAATLAVGKHFVSIAAGGTPAGAVSQSWSFVIDPAGAYLISPDVRNGSFELVDGVAGNTEHVSDWARIDDWGDDSGVGAKTEPNALATDGSRFFVTGGNSTVGGSQTYNITETTINDGDYFGYSFVVAGRPNGVYAGLAYSNVTGVVIVSNSLQYVGGGTTPFPVNGSYVFDGGRDPDAIGKPVGVIFIDNAAGSGSVQIDDVRLYPGESPTVAPVIVSFDVTGSTATLAWSAGEDLGRYSIQGTPNLIVPSWSPVVSNMPPGSYTNNFTISGIDAEFYRVVGE